MTTVKALMGSLKDSRSGDEELISRAFSFAEHAHAGQKRLSGDPYFLHVYETAMILAEYGMGATTVAAGLLHDILEDTSVSPETVRAEFGPETLFLIQGVSKLGKLKYHGTDRHNESLRKLFVAMSEDIRVLMIKLADRLHNIRTLAYVPEEKQRRIAAETLEIYAPIAYRLGIRKLSRELEDLAFPYVYPKEHELARSAVRERYEESLESLEKFLKSVKKALAKEGVPYLRTEYRVKGLFSLYKKLQTKKKRPEEVTDILALRVIVETPADCYRVLGAVHGTWRPLPGRIKDYIAFPKPNGYQALHTTVFTGDGSIVEIQIKTEVMYEHSEYGIASHISYKGDKKAASVEWIRSLLPKARTSHVNTKNEESVPGWIKDLVRYQKEDTEVGEDRNDFFDHRIFVFSPKGDVVDLPIGSTPIDFAYAIHSDIGSRVSGAKINQKMVSLDTELQNGDIVEIIAKPQAKPNAKWLEYVKTTHAKRRIRSMLQKLRTRER